jgi:hypothetical protein
VQTRKTRRGGRVYRAYFAKRSRARRLVDAIAKNIDLEALDSDGTTVGT